MRYVFGFMCVLAQGVVGCSETAGTGGSGGDGGNGGTATCVDNVCPCTGTGVVAALGEGGGPFLFDCQGMPSLYYEYGLLVYQDVILESREGTLTLIGNIENTVMFETTGTVEFELRGVVVKGAAVGIDNPEGKLTLIQSAVFGQGGGIINGGQLTLSDSHVRNLWSGGPTTATNSTLSDVFARSLTLTNSTVTGGLQLGGGKSTLSGGVVDGGCVCHERGEVLDCNDVVTSNGYNIESPGDTCGFDQDTDLVNITEGQLDLGELANNGGPTMTHALGADSVAIDHIPAVDCGVTTDQRGEPRPVGEGCDVGSFERQPEDP